MQTLCGCMQHVTLGCYVVQDRSANPAELKPFLLYIFDSLQVIRHSLPKLHPRLRQKTHEKLGLSDLGRKN